MGYGYPEYMTDLPDGDKVGVSDQAYKKKLFVSCNGSKKNRVGRSVKRFFWLIFLVKNVCFMHVFRWLGVGRVKKTLG